jgi:CRISPR-associated protein Csx1
VKGFAFSTTGKIEGYEEVNFFYSGNSSRSKLAVLCIGKEENVKPIIFVPHSLPENNIKLLKELSQDAAVVRSPALGKFGGTHYKIPYYSLVFFYLFHFLQFGRTLEKSKVRFFTDIGIGFNVLSIAMVEALRFLRVFYELSMIGKGKKEKPSFYIFYSEPVQRGITDYNIYKEDFKPKAFLSLPINWNDLKEVRKTVENLLISEELKEELMNLIERALYTISAVLKNVPLAIYLLGYDKSEEIESAIQNFLKEMEPFMGNAEEPPLFEKNGFEVKYLFTKKVNHRITSNILLLLGFYKGISNILQEERIPSAGKKDVKISDFKEAVKNIYSRIGIQSNEIIFKKDVERIESLFRDKNLRIKGWIDGERIDKEHGKKVPNSRNFLAHSGLLTNLMQFDIAKHKIRYKNSRTELIKKFLREI